MRKLVLDKVAGASPIAQTVFKFAYDYKLAYIRKGYDTPILNRYVFYSYLCQYEHEISHYLFVSVYNFILYNVEFMLVKNSSFTSIL